MTSLGSQRRRDRQTDRQPGWLDMYSFADIHAHSVGKQDDFVTQSSFLPFFLSFSSLQCTKSPLEGRNGTPPGRGKGRKERRRARKKDGREARASKSNFLFLKKDRPNGGGRKEREGRRSKQEETQKGQRRSFVRLPACLIATLPSFLPSFLRSFIPSFHLHLGNRHRQTQNARTI